MIESQNLTKSFGGRTVVNDVSFRVEPGTVTGFLGANGAGKTTTLRMLSGLSEPDSGQAVVLGGRYRDLANPGRRVGILLDAAAQHDGRRGREALIVSAQMMGVDPRRVDGLLDLVGLDRSAARKRVRHYSLGMRQRLGLAHALLGDPQVLILDEPANGLDPPGMRWMRELLRDFADRGGTVLLSSHLLHEVEALADRLVIIDVGRIVAEGSRAELLAGAGTLVIAPDEAALRAALDAANLPARPARDGGFIVDAEHEDVGRAALAGGVVVSRIGPSGGSGLEQLFFDLDQATGGGRMSATAATLELPVAGLDHDRRPGLARLTGVELRKMVDTRAGFWLQLFNLGLMIAFVVVALILADAQDRTFQDLMWIALWPASSLLPVVGVLLISSEWSQRTSLITFALVPRRTRVLAAKLGAALILSVVMLATALAIAAVGTAVAGPSVDGTWSLPPEMLGQAVVYMTTSFIMGLAFGAMFLASAPAIVLYSLLPGGWALLSTIPALEVPARWLDNAHTLTPMADHVLSGTEWARAGTTLALWVLLPAVIGAWRVIHDEV